MAERRKPQPARIADVRSDALRYALAMFMCVGAGFVGLIAILYWENIALTLVVFAMFTVFVVLCANDRRFTSPAAIFALFYYPYSTWYAYNRIVGGYAYDHDSLLQSLFLGYIGLFAFSLAGLIVACGATVATRLVRHRQRAAAVDGTRSAISIRLMTLFAIAVVSIGILEAMLSGASSKRELVDAGSSMQQVVALMAVVLAACVILSIRAEAAWRRDRGLWMGRALLQLRVVVPFAVLLLAMLATGERDYVFRFGFCVLAAYFSVTRRAGDLVLLTLITGLVLILPVSQAAKALLLPGAAGTLTYGMEAIFGGEFLASSRNTYMLLDHGVIPDPSFLWGDVARGLLPFAGADGFESSGSWYNRVFRAEHGFAGTSGWGFGLVPLGVLVGGTGGVILVLSVVSAMLHVCYFLRARSEWWMTFYILALSATIYCIRADLANFLSQVFKIAGSAVFCLYIASRLLRLMGVLAKFEPSGSGGQAAIGARPAPH